jgi:hypothetical protein
MKLNHAIGLNISNYSNANWWPAAGAGSRFVAIKYTPGLRGALRKNFPPSR